MKILQLVSNPGVGGTESFVIGLIPKLRELGLDVHLANLWDGGGEAIEHCSPRGIPCHALNLGKRKFHFGARKKLRAFLQQEKFDLVMAYGLRVTLLLRFAARYSGRPVLVTGLRGMDAWRKWQHVWMDRLTDRWMDYYVGVSEAVCRAHREREKISPAKMLHIPNGIDTRFFSREAKNAWPSREELGLPTGRLSVTIAHYRAVKGYVPFQLEVVSRIVKDGGSKYDDVKWVWVGEGADEPMMKAAAAERGLSQRIFVHGVSRDVRNILAHAELFFLSSKDEGMPRGLMEAMAMGVPSMATKVGGIPEVIRDQTDGLLVPYGDVEAAANAMRRMLDSAELRGRFAQSGRGRIEEQFSFDAIARKYADLYRRLIARDATVTADYGFAGTGSKMSPARDGISA
jgi:glycosyltransferase involved in cell wall biosynthesis